MSAVNPFEALPGAAPVSAAPDVEANPFASLPDAPGPTLAKAANEGDPFASLPITQKPQMPTPQPQARSATEAPDSTAPWWQRAAAADARIGGELYGALGRGTNRAAFDIIQPVTDAAQYAAKSVTAPLDFARKAVGLSGPNQINKALTNVQAANADIEKANAVPAGTPLAVSVVGSLPEMASMIGQAALTGGASDIADTAEGGGMLARLLANAPEGMRSMIPSALEQADATAHQALNAGKTPSQASAAAAASFTSTLLMGAMPGASKLERVASGAVGVPALGEAQNAATSAALGEPYKPAPASDITNALLGAGLGVLGHGAPDAQTPREQPETEQVESRQTETAETSNPFMSLPQGQILTPPRAMGDVQHLPGKKEPALPSLAEATQGAENVPQTAAIGAENVSPTAAINAPAVPAIPALQQSLADVDQRIQAATGNTRDQLLKQRAALQLAASLEPTSADIQAPTPTPPESQGPQEAPAQATPAANQAAPIRPPDEIKREASTTAGSSQEASGTQPIAPKAAPGAPRSRALTVNARTDDLLAAIAKYGGLNKAGAEAEGIDPADTRATFGYRIHRVFTKNGKSLDEMAELLSQHGYPVFDEKGDYSGNVLLDRLDDALRGKKIYSTAFDYTQLPQPEERPNEPLQAPEESETGTGVDYAPDTYDEDQSPHDRVMQDLSTQALAANYDVAQPLVEDWSLGKISDDDAADKLQAIINARAENDETAKREQATSPVGNAPQDRREGAELRQNAPVADAQGDRHANQGLELTQEVAPTEAPKRPLPVQADMLGGATDTAQALHRAEIARDEARNSGQQSAETGNPNDLFSAARQQRDIEDEPPTPVSASEQWDGMDAAHRNIVAIESGLSKKASESAGGTNWADLGKTKQNLIAKKLTRIEDFGEKIGAARKDTAIKTGARPKAPPAPKDERPASERRYAVSEILTGPDKGKFAIRDTKRLDYAGRPHLATSEKFSTQKEAEDAIPLLAVGRNHFVRTDRHDTSKHAIFRRINDSKAVQLKGGFESETDALQYMADHAREISAIRTNGGEELLPKPETVTRAGPERRQGDAKPEDFQKAFGFRGVEFGKWNNNEERQEVMNHAYDGLHDLAELLHIPPRAISLNGDLALAFGARGQGLSGARAHYEPERAVINLTKMQGAGALAHEWMHALDHYLSRVAGDSVREFTKDSEGHSVFGLRGKGSDYASLRVSDDGGMRPELIEAWRKLVETVRTKAVERKADTDAAERFVGHIKDELATRFARIRQDISTEARYGLRKAPATPEQLAEFDALAKKIVDGEDLDLKIVLRSGARVRATNDTLEKMGALLKKVRGSSGLSEHGALTDLQGYMRSYRTRLNLVKDAREGVGKKETVPTSYRMEAVKADQGRGGSYWATPHELMARAFSSYIEDKLAAEHRSSDFLSYGSNERVTLPLPEEPKPFPGGEERKAIDSAFDNFFNTLKHEETPKGVRLYSLKERHPVIHGDSPGNTVMGLIGLHDEAFKYPLSHADTLTGTLHDIYPEAVLHEEPHSAIPGAYADHVWKIELPDGGDASVFQKGHEVWIDVLALKPRSSEGGRIYQAVGDWAHNAHLVFKGDPAGLSASGLYRRTEQMLSSALRWSTTEHLLPHPRQIEGDKELGVSPIHWVPGDDAHNIEELERVGAQNTANLTPEIRHVRYNPERKRFERFGKEFTNEDFDRITEEHRTELEDAREQYRSRLLAERGTTGRRESGLRLPGEIQRRADRVPAQRGQPDGLRPQVGAPADARLRDALRELVNREYTAGRGTLKRSVLIQSILRSPGSFGPESLGALGRELPASLVELLYSKGHTEGAPLPKEAVESRIAPVRERAGVPRIVVDEGESAFPADAQDEIKSLGHSGNVEGYYDPATDTVHLNASNLDSVDDVDRVLAHELFHARLHSPSDTETSRVTGHLGLRDVFGSGIDPILNRVALSYGKSGLQDILDEYHLDWNNPAERRIAAEEKLADIAQTGEKPSLIQHLVNFVRGWLRRLVPSLKLSDSEVLGMVNEIRGGSGRAGPEGKHALYSLGNPEDAKDIDDAHDAIKGGQADVAIESLKSKGIPTETLGTHVLKDVQPELPDIPSASAGRPVPHRTDEYYEQLAAKGHAGFRERTRDSLNGLTQKWHAFVAQLKTDEQKVAAAAVRREMTRYELLESNRSVKIAELRGFFAKLGVGGTGVWIGRYEEGDRSMPHAAEVERILADQLDVEHRSGVDVGELKNYLPHYYYKGAEFQKWLVNWQAEKFGGKSGFQKRRVFPTLAEAMEAGFKPRFSNLADALFLRVHQGMHQARRARTLQNLLRLGMIRVSSRAEQLRPGETLYETKDLGAYAVPEQIAPILGNGIDPKDLWTDQSLPATVFRAWMNFKVPVISAQLGFSLFHLTHEILGLRAGSGVGERVNAFLNTGATEDSVGKLARDLLLQVSSVGNTTPFSLARIRVALRGGWANLSSGEKLRMRSIGFTEGNSRRLTEEEATLARLIVEGGLPTTNPLEYRGSVVKNMEHALQDKDVIGAGLRAPLVVLRAIQVPIMDWLVPNLKIAAFVDGARTLLQTHPDLLDNEPKRLRLLGDLTENIEKRFGQMSYDRLFWSKPFKGILQGTFLSFAWNYGFVHQFGGGLKDLVLAPYHTFGRIALDRDDKIITSRAVYALTYLTLASLSSSLLQWALTGKHPTSMEDLAYPQIGGVNADGTPKRVTTPFFTRELGAMYYHSRDEGVVHGIGEMVFDKLSPVLNILGDQWNNKNFYGQELSNPNDTLPEQTVERIKALGVSLLPLSTQPLARPGNTGKDFALALAGFNPAPGYVRQSAMVAQIWQNFDRYNATTKTSLQVEQSNVRKALITLYQSGDTQDFQQKLTDAVQTYHWSRAQVIGIFKELNEPPAAYAYQQLPRMVKVKLFEKMSPADQERYAPYLGRRAIADAPPGDQKKIEDALQSLREHPPQAAANP